ncbi:MAG: glycosyltransferase family 4 protein [Thermoguttaceae bacterium]|nr:glycosyltransferase family 4 protein [Thermoguttaceae bacterium]
MRNERREDGAPRPRAIYISPGDPWGNPRGGQTAFAKQALEAFGNRFAVVSPAEIDDLPVGRWTLGDWKGEPIWRFNIGSYAPRNKSRAPLIPRRVVFRALIKKYLPEIYEIETKNIFCDSPEVLGVLKKYRWDSFCYRFAGLNNPVEFSRYARLRFLGGWFHRRMLANLVELKPDALLAAADAETTAQFAQDNKAILKGLAIESFPTRFDPSVFYPTDGLAERRELGWEEYYPRLLITGRLSWLKGWDLALDALAILKRKFSNPRLIFVGDGEDRAKIEKRIRELGIQNEVCVEGFLPPSEVRRRLAASDLYLISSLREGWSVASTEALACGKRLVATDVSGVSESVADGKNGFIVRNRDPEAYARAICDALEIPTKNNANEFSTSISKRFSKERLRLDWARLWKPLADD